MQQSIMPQQPECEKCHSKFTYVLFDGMVVCRRCGHRGRKENNNQQLKGGE